MRENGQLSGRYLFMIVMACAIATLGLLLSSPAVIIGAMLISPLMGPIMLMGFSLSTLDHISLRRSVVSLACGTIAALAISILIVKLSPLSEATPEILARTRPNFFDLLVAIFSGLAGGYAVIHRKGETIVGVAIATALMPPLAVTGFGIAVGAANVAGGAFFLFMTNLLAIALSVTILSRIYGFGGEHGRHTTIWQSVLILSVFAALSFPLIVALRDIAFETSTSLRIRESLTEPFNETSASVSDLSIAFPHDQPIQVSATVLTQSANPAAKAEIERALAEQLRRPVVVELNQVVVNEDEAVTQRNFLQLADSSLGAPLRAEMSTLKQLSERRRSEAELRAAATFPLQAADIDSTTMKAVFFGQPDPAFPLSAWHVAETRMAENYPDWDITISPPLSELPLIPFSEGSDTLPEDAASIIENCIWALERWGMSTIEVVGYASTAGDLQRFDNQALAYRRAKAVADLLTEAGFEAIPIGEYRAFQQQREERNAGRLRYQSVLIRPKSG